MTNTPSETEIDNLLCKHWPAYSMQAVLVKMWLREAIKSAIAKWAAPQPQAGAVPQGWKAVPVNPTPEMWKAAKTVPDPNPPYPPHYGLVWDAMLAASPTPPAEQPIGEVVVTKTKDGQIVSVTRQDDEGRILSVIATSDPAKQQTHPGAVYAELHEPDATTVGLGAVWNRHSMRDFADRTHVLRMQAATKAAPGEPSDVEIDDFLDSPACITWVIASNRDRYRLLVRAVLAKWAAPQPAPAPLSDDVVKDAARYRWLIDQHWIQTEVDWRLISTHQDSTIRQLDAAIDAAIAAQGGS